MEGGPNLNIKVGQTGLSKAGAHPLSARRGKEQTITISTQKGENHEPRVDHFFTVRVDHFQSVANSCN
jgi:hypothetical protein